jgi:hypothetical protein
MTRYLATDDPVRMMSQPPHPYRLAAPGHVGEPVRVKTAPAQVGRTSRPPHQPLPANDEGMSHHEMLGDIAQAGRYYHDALRIPDEAMRRTALRTAADLSATAIRTALAAGIPVQVVAAWSPFGRRFIQHLADLADLANI